MPRRQVVFAFVRHHAGSEVSEVVQVSVRKDTWILEDGERTMTTSTTGATVLLFAAMTPSDRDDPLQTTDPAPAAEVPEAAPTTDFVPCDPSKATGRDGARLASAGDDRRVRVWEAAQVAVADWGRSASSSRIVSAPTQVSVVSEDLYVLRVLQVL
jgi:hypothetical protein